MHTKFLIELWLLILKQVFVFPLLFVLWFKLLQHEIFQINNYFSLQLTTNCKNGVCVKHNWEYRWVLTKYNQCNGVTHRNFVEVTFTILLLSLFFSPLFEVKIRFCECFDVCTFSSSIKHTISNKNFNFLV